RLKQNGKIFSVCDLSPDGMAIRILDRNDLILFTMSRLIEGTLNLRGEKVSVQARVKRITGDAVGCEFESLLPEARTLLEKFLDPKALGQEIKPLPVSERQNTLWYHGPSGTDLLLKRGADGQYTKLMLYVLGIFIQWDHEEGLSTGRTESDLSASEVRGVV